MDALAELARAQALADGGDMKGAIAGAERALQLDPELEPAIYWLATLEGTRQAGGYRARLERLAPHSVRASRALGAFLMREQERDRALAAFARAIEKDTGGVLVDLHKLGAHADAIALCGDRYRPEKHGISAGLALAASYAATHAPEKAQDVLAALDAIATIQDRPAIAELGATLAAKTRGGGGAVELVSWVGPLWAAAADAPLADRPKAPQIAVFSWADLRSSAGGPRGSAGGPGHAETSSGRMARSAPLVLADRLREAFAIETVTLVPVVRGAGLYVATEPWPLPLLVRFAPQGVRWILSGELSHGGASAKARIQLWNLEKNALAKTLTVSGADVPEIVRALEPKLHAALVASRAPRSSGRIAAWVPSVAYADALADVEAQMLVAEGAIPEAQTWSVGAAADNLAALIAESPDRGARLGRALIACRKKIGREIPQKLAALLAAT